VNEPVPPGPFSPQGAAEVLAALDSAGVARAAVLSSAYLFGMPDVGFENQQASVMAENDYVSREVAKHRERLVGFCSVNPLAEYAMSEVTRCSTLPGMVGLKLHFANSDVDLRNRVLSVPSLDVSHALSADIFRRHARSPKGHKLIAENLEPCGMR